MWNDKITVGIPKPETEPKDVREMRKAIEAASRDSALVRSVFDAGRYQGFSGEDLYTMLAYHALRQLEVHSRLNLDWLNANPAPPIIVPANLNGGVE